MLYKVLGLCMFLVVLNCKSIQNQNKLEKEDSFLIGKGNLYGSGAEGLAKQNLVITDSNQWNDLLKKINAINNVSDGFSETKINFSKYTLIAVFGDVKGTGGHSIELEVKSNLDNIEVYVYSKGPDGMASSVMTQPFIIVRIAKSEFPIVFK